MAERKPYRAVGWVVVKRGGGRAMAGRQSVNARLAEVRQTKPVVAPDEVAVRLTVELPPEAFDPQIEASIVVPEGALLRSEVEVTVDGEATS